MSYSADDYRRQLSALLPRGLAWPRDPQSALQLLLGAIAQELARVDQAQAALLEEADPRSTLALLGEWEAAYGLPDVCLDASGDTVGQRRAALLDRILDLGGQRPADYLAMAAALGVSATLTEYRPMTVADSVIAPLCGPDWAYSWKLQCALAVTPIPHTVAGTVAEPLASWTGLPALECLLRRRKPAHTTLLISYV